MKKLRSIIAFLTALIIFAAVSWTAAWLLMPQRTVYGSTWDLYRAEEENSLDILCFGSSLSYCDLIPAVIWEETGLSGYVMAGPEQTVPIMYHYVREACKTQNPRLVLAEVTNVFYNQYQNYTKANISYMPFGTDRFAAAFAAAEREELFGLLFPLYNYHYRWTVIESEEVENRIFPADDITAGYTLLTESCDAPTPAELDYSSDTANYRRNIDYIEKLKNFCDKENIELLCYVTPSAGKIPTDALDALRSDLGSFGVELVDFNDSMDLLGLNNDTDWYDPLHFNLRGAEKFSRFLGGWINDNYDFTASSTNTELWCKRAEHIRTALAELG